MPDRDPRIDPTPGDELLSRHPTRRYRIRFSANPDFARYEIYSRDWQSWGAGNETGTISLMEWRRIAANWIVEKVAGGSAGRAHR